MKSETQQGINIVRKYLLPLFFPSQQICQIYLSITSRAFKPLPHNAAHRMSDPKRFLYFRISGVSPALSVVCDGVTLTLICDPRRDCDDSDVSVPVPPPAPKPNAEKDLWWRMEGCWLTAWRYCWGWWDMRKVGRIDRQKHWPMWQRDKTNERRRWSWCQHTAAQQC